MDEDYGHDDRDDDAEADETKQQDILSDQFDAELASQHGISNANVLRNTTALDNLSVCRWCVEQRPLEPLLPARAAAHRHRQGQRQRQQPQRGTKRAHASSH